MDEREVLAHVAAILTTALETEPDPFPESLAYLAMDMDLGKWETVRGVMVDIGVITIRGNLIGLTAKGRRVAEGCNALLV